MTDKKKVNANKKLPHAGHRQRMDERVKNDPDFNNFAYHEMLEYLLYNGIPRSDTNELAHRLIDRFGTFYNVFSASIDELCQVKGMTIRAACTLASVLPISRWVYNKSKSRQKFQINNTDDAIKFISPFFYNRTIEQVYMVCLDSANYVTNSVVLSRGSFANVPFDIREVVTKANNNMAAKVVLAHNHPSGILVPSMEDIAATSRASSGLGAIYITLVDHLIFVPSGEYYSFYQSGILNEIVIGSDNILGGNQLKEELSLFSSKEKMDLVVKKVGSDFLFEIYKKAIERFENDNKYNLD